MSDTAHYGNFYFCVKVSTEISRNGEIYLMADQVSLSPDGALIFSKKDTSYPNLILAKGTWIAAYTASLLDGSAVAVEHWAGEILEDDDVEFPEQHGSKPATNGHAPKGRMKFPERGKMSQALRYEILERDEFRCKHCGHRASDGFKLHVDHIIPVAKGGKTERSNLQTLCEACNSSKGDD